jgi:hypothetical protein
MDELLKKANELLPGGAVACVLGGVVVLVAVVVLWKLLTRRKPKAAAPPDLRIDVMALGAHGPPAGGPVLEFYNVPVRLAAIVLAPAGRVRELPPLDQLGDVFDAIVPGLASVVAAHRPLLRKWPPQPSTRGFAHQFFAHARLPGEGGKGTPWSSAAGVLKIEGQAMMAGMVLRTEGTSSHGQEIIERPEQWLRTLRVKGA